LIVKSLDQQIRCGDFQLEFGRLAQHTYPKDLSYNLPSRIVLLRFRNKDITEKLAAGTRG